MKVYCLKLRVYDKGKVEPYCWWLMRDKLPDDFSKSNYRYIDYYYFFYTVEAMKNYIRENKVA